MPDVLCGTVMHHGEQYWARDLGASQRLALLSRLQVMTLQGQLGDALQDVGLAKRRQEGQKGAQSRLHLPHSSPLRFPDHGPCSFAIAFLVCNLTPTALHTPGETTKAQLEIAALQFEIDTLKKQLEESQKANALEEDYRSVPSCSKRRPVRELGSQE